MSSVSASADAHSSTFLDFFSTKCATGDLQVEISKFRRSQNHCIILYNQQALQDVLGSGYLSFETKLRSYALGGTSATRYHLLDVLHNRVGPLSGGGWQDHVRLIKAASELFRKQVGVQPNSLLILGDSEMIPMPVFPNPLYGEIPDQDVDSDLPYSTLSLEDPFEDHGALEQKLSVGRIPTGRSDGLRVGTAYFTNAALAARGPASHRVFGVTAEVWEGASLAVAKSVGEVSLQNSPEFSFITNPGSFPVDTNYFYFNVHGSNDDPSWFGERASQGCNAFVSPDHFMQAGVINAIASEACYGARFEGLFPDQSILLSALTNKTVLFVGSSRIAYGPAVSPPGLADIIASEFLGGLKSGQTAGVSLAAARSALLASDFLSPHDLLTIVEFNLFGDPTMKFHAQSSKTGLSSSYQPTGRNPLARSGSSLSVRIPNVLSQVNVSVDRAWADIRQRLHGYVLEKYPVFESVEPVTKSIRAGRTMQEHLSLSYGKQSGPIFSGLALYADKGGAIKMEALTK